MDRPQITPRHDNAPCPTNSIGFNDQLTPRRLGETAIPFPTRSRFGLVLDGPHTPARCASERGLMPAPSQRRGDGPTTKRTPIPQCEFPHDRHPIQRSNNLMACGHCRQTICVFNTVAAKVGAQHSPRNNRAYRAIRQAMRLGENYSAIEGRGTASKGSASDTSAPRDFVPGKT